MSRIADDLKKLGIEEINPAWFTGQNQGEIDGVNASPIYSPTDGELIAKVNFASPDDYHKVMTASREAFKEWRKVTAPARGEIVRQIGEKLRTYKEPLGKLVSYEMGKIYQEGLGEVQEMIDICDFAVGLSRQLYGLTMHSERPNHRMYEQWHPLGVVGVISAFNFPVAVWSWNAMIAAVCGDVVIWKPSEKTPLTAVACANIVKEVLNENNLPEGIFNVIIGDRTIGQLMAADKKIDLISATGSIRMGKAVAETAGKRLGKTLLELGGNNAMIVSPNADIEMAVRAIVFGSVGTAGQRCTSTRRLIVHESIYDQIKDRLAKVYENLPIGHSLDEGTLVGPLIDEDAVNNYKIAVKAAQEEGGKLLVGGEVVEGMPSGNYVKPTIIEAKNSFEIVQEETFAPILYMMKYEGDIENAIDIQNDVKQGLSSALFTTHMQEMEAFLNYAGSDCGIANVNIGTSGAEIGGAFGGEKETGGGRESGSDAWKAYMRRQTNTINYSKELPLAQGITFDI